MEKVIWDTMIVPGLRQRLIDKYVPKEPIDPLVYKVTAFYWLLQELVGNWKMGKRLTLEQKTQLLQLLVWNLSQLEPEPEPEPEPDIDIDEQVAQLVLACKNFI
jgi:uncharacterized protein YeaC (DUF1315 family)